MSQTPLPDLDEATVLRSYDRGTVERARAYAAEDRVDDIVLRTADPEEVVLTASVAGTAQRPYEVELAAVRMAGRWELYSDCTCPVGVGCKHGAALALVLSRHQETAATPEAPLWTARLERVLDDLDAGPTGGRAQRLALEVSLDRPGAAEDTSRDAGHRRAPSWQVQASRPSLRLRPLAAGARGTWIRRGVGWGDLTKVSYSRTYEPEQLAPLLELSGARRSPTYYSSGDSPLDDFGPGLWAMLERARAAGVQLVGGAGVRSVTLLDRPLSLTAELRSDRGSEDGLDGAPDSAPDSPARLTVGVWHDQRWWSGEELLIVGQRGHGIGLLDPVTEDLVLAQLDRLVPEPVRRLVETPDPLVIPPDQADLFLTTHLPRLRRHLPVSSTDGSVAVPEEQPPALVLTIAWKGPGAAEISWGWRYRTGEHEVRTELDPAAASPAGVRRHDRERAHLARLDLGPTGDELLRGEDGALAGRRVLRGDRLLTLVGEVLPALREDPLVEVEDVGVQPDHRAAEGEPEIRFELDEGAAEGRVDWLNLRVVIDVDGEQVALSALIEALTEAARHGEERVFLPSGRHLPAAHPALARLADAVRAAEELVERTDDDRIGVGAGDLGLWGELAEIGVVDHQARQWVEAAQALRGLTTLPKVDPPGMASTLREYQLDGFRWLAFLHDSGLGGILADDMGLGKTLQTLALISHARSRGSEPFLVVAPTSVVPGWVREAAAHAPGLDVRAVTAGRRRRGEELKEVVAGADVVVTTYTLLRLEADDYAAMPWGGLVLDEAQQVKNHQGKTYQAVRLIEAPFRLALTGTPFENRLMELWSLLSIVAPGLYPHPKRFGELVAGPVEKHGDEAALRRFRTRIRPFLLRRTKELVAADLPPKQEQVLDVALGAKHRKVYDAHLQRERQHILGLIAEDFNANRVAIFRSLTKLRQLSLDPALVDPELDSVGSAKIDLLVDHLRELAEEGHRALVFSQFTSFLARVRARLDAEGLSHSYLDGRTRDREAVIEGFRGGDDTAFLISLKAGGVGLTLTEATYVFVLDPWWNPATEAQAVDRAHRIGQHSPVTVYRLVATDTIEEKVMELKARKAALFAQVVDGDGAMSGAVTAADVRALFDD
ncbi:SNF2-related protein [Nocardioides marmotae]|uniref:DEAD/DEAH box helicase n=1 Tax=Nocardioides marmotae TaxID=2663857 RepID=UPI0012B655D7|nr:DEAD/DEAH box helicase [Nocardioides marmotae]MBC9734353.1 DEAD/DEAH box helicase [Nocardioides marmotae]MTB85452.1 helicase SNF2 [Nocardioides marmotae]